MKRALMRRHVAAALAGLFAVSAAGHAGEAAFVPNVLLFPNPTGFAATYSVTGKIPLNGPFFQSLGSNGRSCGSCHQPGDGSGAEHDDLVAFLLTL
jgi:cytochrome c peroxidase